jgi:alpha-L-fucosidase
MTPSIRRRHWTGFVFAIALCAGLAAAQGAPRARLAADPPDPRLDWWREARFGLFIHWGLYAVPAGEWNGRTEYGEWIRHTAKIPIGEYERFRERFNPVRFNPDEWVRLAKAAGMKYIVITSKHHDGFALFDSKVTDWDVMATPYGRDILKQLAAACQREGIRLCFYHSIMDWHHPDYLPRRDWEQASRPAAGADFDRYVRYMKAQLKELLTGYGPIGVLWFDGQWEGTWTNQRGNDLYDYVRQLQPSIIINNRVGRAGGDFGLNRDQGLVGDFGTPEQEIPATGVPGLDWETCMTMNRNWGYNRADKDFKTTEVLIRNLVDIASKGGNFLLNVGPTAEGEFPPESVDRLKSIGDWMRVYGQSIHGTNASPFPSLPWGRATERRIDATTTRLYLHIFGVPADRVLIVPGLLNEVKAARFMGDPLARTLEVERRGDNLRIALGDMPNGADRAPDVVVELDIAGEPDVTIAPAIDADASIFVDTLDVRVSTARRNVHVRYTTDGSQPTATSPVAIGAITLTQSATVRAQAYRGDTPVSGVTDAAFARVTPRPALRVTGVVPGLDYKVVEGDFQRLPDFDVAKPSRSGTVATFDLTPRTREMQFAFEFRGFIDVPATGVYHFYVRSDDGSRLWLDDVLVVDNDGLHSSRELSNAVALEKGLHPLRVAMFEQSGGFELGVSWSGPGLSKTPVPAGVLHRK